MSRNLVVGDPHVRPVDIQDCERLLQAVENSAQNEMVDRILFLGDEFHTMTIVDVEVLAFWDRWLRRLASIASVVLLVGNHDRPADRGSPNHALVPFKGLDSVVVVDHPWYVDNILFLPFYFEPQDFVAAANKFPEAKTLVCHQTLMGATYDNGFYSKDAADSMLVKQGLIISGHIHTEQRFGKVFYPGSPRWLGVSDANVNKYLWVMEFEDGVMLPNPKKISTDAFCSRLVHLQDVPEAPLDFQPIGNHRYVIDIRGPQGWIDDRKSAYVGRARIRTFRTDTQAPRIRESDGIDAALKKYVQAFRAPNQTPPEVLQRMANERFFRA